MSSENDNKRKRDDQEVAPPSATDTDTDDSNALPEPAMTMADMKCMLDETRIQMQVMQTEITHIKTLGYPGNDAMSYFKLRRLQSDIDFMEMENTLKLSSIGELEERCRNLEEKSEDLEEKNILFEYRCDSLERSLQLLKKKQKWRPSAPSIPSSYWERLGFDEYGVDSMEFFIKQLEDVTSDLGRGVDRIDIALCEENYGTTLLHDQVLLPHWKAFADALQLYPYSLVDTDTRNKFSICYVQLTSVVLNMLAPALKIKGFDTFELEGNELENVREGIDFAVEFIESNPRLDDFSWNNNAIGSMDNANRLLQALIRLPNFTSISFNNCCGETANGYNLLLSFLAKANHFKEISLSSNNIRTAGGTHISNCLANNPHLESLMLDGNHLDDNDAILIAEALKLNTNLKCLSLERNAISDVGWDALRHTLFDSTTFNSVFDSNHTCRVSGLDSHNQRVSVPKDNRRRKFFLKLSSRHKDESNVFHLNQELGNGDNDYSLKLVPMVLECVHLSSEEGYRECLTQEAQQGFVQKNDAVTPLSIMHEIVRSWKMPEMYEYRGTSS